jgi:hypothetical protein
MTQRTSQQIKMFMNVSVFITFIIIIIIIITNTTTTTTTTNGARGGVVVKALRYKPAGRGFDSRWCHWNFSVT